MSKKCRAYSESKLGLEPADNRKAFYAGWDAALAEQPAQQRPQNCGTGYCSCIECPYEQPAQQQEPVAYASDVEFDDETEIIPAEQKGKLGTAGLRIPLYIKPPASKPWVGLTDEEIAEIDGVEMKYIGTGEYVIEGEYEFARDIEAKLREKNA